MAYKKDYENPKIRSKEEIDTVLEKQKEYHVVTYNTSRIQPPVQYYSVILDNYILFIGSDTLACLVEYVAKKVLNQIEDVKHIITKKKVE